MNLIEVYWKIDILKFDNVNVEHGFTFKVHLLQNNCHCDNANSFLNYAFTPW